MEGRSIARRFVVGLVCLVGSVAADRAARGGPKQQTDTELAREATDSFGNGAAVNRRFLLAALSSSNRFQRKLALEEIDRYPGFIDRDVVLALVPLLEETTPLPPVECVHAIDGAGDTNDGENPGMALAFASCLRRPQTSNGSLAAALLKGRSAFPLVIGHVVRRPQSAEPMIASLGTAGLGPASEVASSLAAAKQPEVQAALLRFLIAEACEPPPAAVPFASAIKLVGSPDTRVNQLAALAILRLADCRPDVGALSDPRRRAASQLEIDLRNLGDRGVVDRTALLGRTARAFVPALLARFERASGDVRESTAILAIISSLGDDGRAAAPALVRVLRDGKRSALWARTLAALAAVGAPSGDAKPAILDALRASDMMLLVPAVQALAQVGARLNQNEFSPLVERYRARCGFGGVNSSVRPIECTALSKAMVKVASAGGQTFQSVESRY